jgi:hypothetical protein
MPDFFAQVMAGGIVGLVIIAIFALESGYKFGSGFAAAALIVLGAESFTGRWLMVIGTVIFVSAAIAIGLAVKGKI